MMIDKVQKTKKVNMKQEKVGEAGLELTTDIASIDNIYQRIAKYLQTVQYTKYYRLLIQKWYWFIVKLEKKSLSMNSMVKQEQLMEKN